MTDLLMFDSLDTSCAWELQWFSIASCGQPLLHFLPCHVTVTKIKTIPGPVALWPPPPRAPRRGRPRAEDPAPPLALGDADAEPCGDAGHGGAGGDMGSDGDESHDEHDEAFNSSESDLSDPAPELDDSVAESSSNDSSDSDDPGPADQEGDLFEEHASQGDGCDGDEDPGPAEEPGEGGEPLEVASEARASDAPAGGPGDAPAGDAPEGGGERDGPGLDRRRAAAPDATIVLRGGHEISFYRSNGTFQATCNTPGHVVDNCRLSRTSNASMSRGRAGQGRPIGLLASWCLLSAELNLATKDAHRCPLMLHTAHDRGARIRGRVAAQACAGYAALAACERARRDGEDEEPETVP